MYQNINSLPTLVGGNTSTMYYSLCKGDCTNSLGRNKQIKKRTVVLSNGSVVIVGIAMLLIILVHYIGIWGINHWKSYVNILVYM